MNASRDVQPSSTRRLGRRVAVGLYFVVLAYLAVIGFVSVIPQVFFPTSTIAAVADCDSLRDELATELRETASDYVELGRASESSLETFFHGWDDRYHALAEHCSGDRDASLAELRYRLETTLRRYGREEATLVRTFLPNERP